MEPLHHYVANNIVVAVALLFGIILFTSWRLKSSSLRSLPYPPGPPVTGWISGHASIIPAIQPWKVYSKWAKKYGPVFHLRVYTQHIFVLSSVADCNELFEKRSNLYSDRPSLTMIDLMGWDFNTGMMRYGSRWRRLRRLWQQAFKKVASKSYRPEQTLKINEMLHGLLTDSEHFLEHVKTVSGAISMSITYGYDVKPKNDYFVGLSEEALSRMFFAFFPGAALVNTIPILRHLPAWFPGAGFHKIAADTRVMTTKLKEIPFDWVRKNMDAGAHRNCLVTEYLPSCATEQDTEVLQEFAAVVYAAGADTTTSSLKTFFYAMTIFPDVQKRAQEELDAIVGSNRLPNYDDWKSLPYIEALVREILRWRPITPLGVSHAVTEDDVFKGYFIPKGSTIIPNVWAMTREETRYTNPEAFNPDRFFTKDGSLNEDDLDYTFGFGRRACPGRHLARATLWLSIASTLWAFNISKAKDAEGNEIPIHVEYSDGLVSHPSPHACSITARSLHVKNVIEEVVAHARS